jgi:hypothetical protein
MTLKYPLLSSDTKYLHGPARFDPNRLKKLYSPGKAGGNPKHRLLQENCIMRFYAALTIALIFATSTPAAIQANYNGKPYSGDTIKGKPHQIPGIIKSVFFDEGGQNVAFYEVTADNGSNLSMRDNRDQDWQVDMQPFQYEPRPDFNVDGTKEALGSWHMSWIAAGEWLKYTVHVNTAGVYYVSLKISMVDKENLATISFNDGKADSIKNLKTVTTPAECQKTGLFCEIYHMWDIYNNVDSMTLDTGLFVLKYKFDKGEQNFDWIKFTLKNATAAKTRANLPENRAMDVAAAFSGSTLNVSYNHPRPDAGRVRVVDCAGRTVFNAQTTSRRASYKLPALAKGLYFVHIDQAGESATAIVPLLK